MNNSIKDRDLNLCLNGVLSLLDSETGVSEAQVSQVKIYLDLAFRSGEVHSRMAILKEQIRDNEDKLDRLMNKLHNK